MTLSASREVTLTCGTADLARARYERLLILLSGCRGVVDLDHHVHDPRHTHGAEREPRVRDRTPGHAQDRRHEQHRAEMDDGGRAKGAHLRPEGARLGAEHDHHKLQSGQRRGGRADDDVEVFPGAERRHGGWLHDDQCTCPPRTVHSARWPAQLTPGASPGITGPGWDSPAWRPPAESAPRPSHSTRTRSAAPRCRL